MKFIKTFSEIGKKDVGIAGGKGASLGEMTRASIPIPPGFVVLTSAFDRFLEETNIGVEIKAELDKVNLEDMNSIDNASRIIQGLIENYEMPTDIKDEVINSYKKLLTVTNSCKYVAVRSSATAEDSSVASFAGQLDTFLYTDRRSLIDNIKRCWASLYGPRAIYYRYEKKLHHTPVSVAVVVQKMINSDVSGITFTVHPVTKDKNQMVIEAGYGLGEAIVGGKITPDTYIVDKSQVTRYKSQINYKSQIPNFKKIIIDKNISEQEMKIVSANP